MTKEQYKKLLIEEYQFDEEAFAPSEDCEQYIDLDKPLFYMVTDVIYDGNDCCVDCVDGEMFDSPDAAIEAAKNHTPKPLSEEKIKAGYRVNTIVETCITYNDDMIENIESIYGE